MKILVIISSILIAQTSASFFDVFQGAVLSVQNSFGKMISDVVSDVKETVDCTILAVEHALALSDDAAIRYYDKCGNTINNTVTVTETRHIESSPQVAVSRQFPSEDYLKKEIPAVIEAKINETLTKILGSYNPRDKLRDVENVLVKETVQLANVSKLVKKELKKVSREVTSDLKNLTNLHVDPSVDSIMQKINLLENKEQNSKNNSQATAIHQVIDEVLVKLDKIEATEATENVKLEHIIKDLELNSNSSFKDLRQQIKTWKEEESRQLDDIQSKILEHERNAHPDVHNNSLNLPPVQYNSDITQTNIKEVNIISTKRISNASREMSSIDTSVNARNKQSHTLTLKKPKTINNGHGNLSGISSTSTSLKISQITPNVSKDSDLQITVISSKSYSLSKSVSISGKVHQAESTTNDDNKRSVHLATDQPPTTTLVNTLVDNKNASISVKTTESTPDTENNKISTNMSTGQENSKILCTEQPTETTSIASGSKHESDSSTELSKATEIENATNILNDYISNNTTTSSDLVTERSPNTQGVASTSDEEIQNSSTTTETVTTVFDTTTQLKESPVDTASSNGEEKSTLSEIDQATTSLSVSDHSIDDTVTTSTSHKPIETSTVSESPEYGTKINDNESKNSQTEKPTTTANDFDIGDTITTTADSNKEIVTELSTEQSTKTYEEEPTTCASMTTTTADLLTESSSEINYEQSTTLRVKSYSVNILNSEYTSNTVTTTTPDITTEVILSTTELSTKSNDEENILKSVTTIKPVLTTEETSEINMEHTSFVGAEITTVQTVTTPSPEVSIENKSELNIEQSTTSYTEEITTSVDNIDSVTTTQLDLSTKSPDIRTAQTTTSDEEIITTENAVHINTEQSKTYKEEPTTKVNIGTRSKSVFNTESPSQRRIEQSTMPCEEEVTNSVSTAKPVRSTEPDIVTESPYEEDTEKSTTSYAKDLSTGVPLHNVDSIRTLKPDLIENSSGYHTKSNTEQSNNLNGDEAIRDASEVNALINKYSNDVLTMTVPNTVRERRSDHVHGRMTTVDEENLLSNDFTDPLRVTASNTLIERTTASQKIQTGYDTDQDTNKHITPSVYDYVTARTPLLNFESPFENMNGDSPKTSTQRSKRTRKRNSARSSRRRSSTSTVTEMSTTIPTFTNIEVETIATAKIPIAILPVFRSAISADPPTIANHIHSNKNNPLENTYVPYYKEKRRMPLRRDNNPTVFNEASQKVNIHEIESSRQSVAQLGTPIKSPTSDLTDNHETLRQNPKPQERNSRHFDEAPKHTVPIHAVESTLHTQQRSTKRNRTRRLDQVTDSPEPIRETTPDLIAPTNRERANRITRRTNNPSNDLTENAYGSRASTFKPAQKNSYDMTPADYDAFLNSPLKDSAAHLEAVSRAHELISNSKSSDLIINSIRKNKKLNGAQSVFDILT